MDYSLKGIKIQDFFMWRTVKNGVEYKKSRAVFLISLKLLLGITNIANSYKLQAASKKIPVIPREATRRRGIQCLSRAERAIEKKNQRRWILR